MSTTDDSDCEKAQQITEAEIISGIEDKVYKAFKLHEREGHAGLIKSSKVRDVL